MDAAVDAAAALPITLFSCLFRAPSRDVFGTIAQFS